MSCISDGKTVGFATWITNRMPEEHDSYFKKSKEWEKLKERGLPEKTSDHVLVTLEFENGERDCGIARTEDGVWKSDTIRFFHAGKKKCDVVAWMPYQAPYKGTERLEK